MTRPEGPIRARADMHLQGMANEDTKQPVTAEDIAKAAAMLSGGDSEVNKTEAEKAAPPFVKEDDKQDDKKDDDKDDKKDVEKSIPVSELQGIVEAAVSKAIEAVKAVVFAGQADVAKSLGVLEAKVDAVATDTRASLSFQGASVEVLKSFQDVTKGIAAQVDEIGAQPAGRRGALTVEKSTAVTETPVAKSVNIEPLMTWSREQGYDIGGRFELRARAESGNYAGIPTEVLKSMGVEA